MTLGRVEVRGNRRQLRPLARGPGRQLRPLVGGPGRHRRQLVGGPGRQLFPDPENRRIRRPGVSFWRVMGCSGTWDWLDGRLKPRVFAN